MRNSDEFGVTWLGRKGEKRHRDIKTKRYIEESETEKDKAGKALG